jgi:hypothetical protein
VDPFAQPSPPPQREPQPAAATEQQATPGEKHIPLRVALLIGLGIVVLAVIALLVVIVAL